MPTLHVELPSNEVALLPLFVFEVTQELGVSLVGGFIGYKDKALYEIRRAMLKIMHIIVAGLTKHGLFPTVPVSLTL